MIFENIYEYIKRPLTERQSHLNLDEQCVEIGGRSTEFRALLSYELKTTIPKGINSVYLCHACNNGKCCNPKHLYWGTPRENVLDMTRTSSWKQAHIKGLKRRDDGGNPSSGKMWIKNLKTKKNKLIGKMEKIPRGWIRGKNLRRVNHSG